MTSPREKEIKERRIKERINSNCFLFEREGGIQKIW
jgi:hypothetical protein